MTTGERKLTGEAARGGWRLVFVKHSSYWPHPAQPIINIQLI